MTNVFQKIFVIISLLYLTSCCFFKSSTANNVKTVSEVLKCDSIIVSHIDKYWYPEKEKKCHPFDGVYFSIVSKYKECFIGVNENDLISIMGKSISDDSNKVVYRISTDCNNYILHQYFLTFSIDTLTRKVSDVSLSGSKISE
jgi:hypothetical protein